MLLICYLFYFFFFNDTATTEIYTLSLHDALPISDSRASNLACPVDAYSRSGCAPDSGRVSVRSRFFVCRSDSRSARAREDRKSTRLNSSHSQISYAVFCLKKKKTKETQNTLQHLE